MASPFITALLAYPASNTPDYLHCSHSGLFLTWLLHQPPNLILLFLFVFTLVSFCIAVRFSSDFSFHLEYKVKVLAVSSVLSPTQSARQRILSVPVTFCSPPSPSVATLVSLGFPEHRALTNSRDFAKAVPSSWNDLS